MPGAVFYLNAPEREQIGAVARTVLPFVQLRNGVPTYRGTAVRPGPPEVLFVARMHPPQETGRVRGDGKGTAREGCRGSVHTCRSGRGRGICDPRCAQRRYPDLMGRCARTRRNPPPADGGRQPLCASVGSRTFPMSVLEAMSVGLPVVITNGCGLASVVERTASGIVTDPAVPALAAAVESVLAEHELARAMGERGGRAVAHADFGMQPVAERLQDVYSRLLGSGP